MRLSACLATAPWARSIAPATLGWGERSPSRCFRSRSSTIPIVSRRLEREARLISQVSHPNICTLFDIVECDNAPVPDSRARRRRDAAAAPAQRPDAAARRAALCVGRLRRRSRPLIDKGIIHRDLKPSNIKLTDRRHDQGAGLRRRNAGARSGRGARRCRSHGHPWRHERGRTRRHRGVCESRAGDGRTR